MKNLSLVLNAVLLIAVGTLYYLHFASDNEATSTSAASTESDQLRLAFINSDTVLKYYDFFKVNRDLLESKGRNMDSDLKNRARALQRDIAEYQNNVGNLTMNQARAIEEDIANKQQNFRMYQETLATELAQEENKLNVELYKRVTDLLKQYALDNNIRVVMKYDPSSDLLFGDSALDITQQVISGLNAAYQAEQAKPAGSQDTTKAIQ